MNQDQYEKVVDALVSIVVRASEPCASPAVIAALPGIVAQLREMTADWAV